MILNFSFSFFSVLSRSFMSLTTAVSVRSNTPLSMQCSRLCKGRQWTPRMGKSVHPAPSVGCKLHGHSRGSEGVNQCSLGRVSTWSNMQHGFCTANVEPPWCTGVSLWWLHHVLQDISSAGVSQGAADFILVQVGCGIIRMLALLPRELSSEAWLLTSSVGSVRLGREGLDETSQELALFRL